MPHSNRYKIFAICGSTRKSSSNLELIHAITDLYEDKLDIEIYHEIDEIPHFNPDLDGENPPEKTTSFRQKLAAADGILICTPEYAMGVPGTLQNALDWTVSSMEFSHKPVALITASSVGQKAHASLMETLKVIESDIPESSQLVISFARTKVKGNKIVDDNTQLQVRNTIDSLVATVEKKRESETA
jgi:chromate reductase, NAD(P)H dehydrogenase (quinone)